MTDIQFNPLDPWNPRPVVGTVTPVSNGWIVSVDGAQRNPCAPEEYTTKFSTTKQGCWDYISRNYPNQIFAWYARA